MTPFHCCFSGPWRFCSCCRGRHFCLRLWPRSPIAGVSLPLLDRRGRALLLWAIAAVVVMGFFSFSSRQEYYVLPILPALTLILGAWLSREQHSPAESPLRRDGKRIALVSFIVSVPLALSAWGLLWFSQWVPPHSELADLLTRNPSEYALSFGHIFDLTPRAMGMFRPELLLIGAALFGGTLASWLLRRRNRPAVANAALAIMMLVSLQCVHHGAGHVCAHPVVAHNVGAVASCYHSRRCNRRQWRIRGRIDTELLWTPSAACVELAREWRSLLRLFISRLTGRLRR